MSCFICELCGVMKDGDWVESYEWGDGEACIDCHTDATPEDWEDWILDKRQDLPACARWTLTHKHYGRYQGKGNKRRVCPEDHRCFLGPTIEDVYQQAIEYEEMK